MRRRNAPILLAIALSCLTATTAAGQAQKNILYDLDELPAGDLRYRTLIYLDYANENSPTVMLEAGFGLDAESLRRRIGGKPGWGKMLEERGYNAWMLNNVGVGRAQHPPDEDLDSLMKWGMYGHYQVGLANLAALSILHGQAAGMGLRAASYSRKFTDAMILIDPIGPQGSQPMMPFDPERLLAERFDEDHIWREWAFGPERGATRDGLDLSVAEAESLYASYDRTNPPQWAGLLTHYDGPFEVEEPMNLEGVPVLVVRTPAADDEQIEREKALVRWMNERGMVVETWDLSEDAELKNVSGLPWAGELSSRVLDQMMSWYESLDGARLPVGR